MTAPKPLHRLTIGTAGRVIQSYKLNREGLFSAKQVDDANGNFDLIRRIEGFCEDGDPLGHRHCKGPFKCIYDDLHSRHRTFKQENFIIPRTTVAGEIHIGLSGRFYDADEGYVDLATNTPFFLAFGESFPSSGELVLNGSAGTKSRLIANFSTRFNLEVDTNGDEIFDAQTAGPWENLEVTKV